MPDEQLKGWNYLPEVPLKTSPFFIWPLKPVEMAKWLWNSWFLITEKLIILGISFACYLWFQPPLEDMKTFEIGWMAQIYMRNILLTLIVAGSLHLWFYTFSAQGKKLKFDPRPLMINGKQFTLGGQVRDNMVWTLGSGVLIWTAFEGDLLLGIGQRLHETDHLRGQPGLVRRDLFPDPCLGEFLFLRHTPAASRAVSLPARPFPAPPQHQCRTLVRHVDAPG